MMLCEAEVSSLSSAMDRLVCATEAVCCEAAELGGREVRDCLDVLKLYQDKLRRAISDGADDALLRACNGMTTINKGLSDLVWPSRHPHVQTLAGEVTAAAIHAGVCMRGSAVSEAASSCWNDAAPFLAKSAPNG